MRITPGAKNLIADKGFDQAYGARYLERAIQKMLEDPLAEEILHGRFGEGSKIRVTKKGEELVFDEERDSDEAVEEAKTNEELPNKMLKPDMVMRAVIDAINSMSSGGGNDVA